jgi:hypothetical protein
MNVDAKRAWSPQLLVRRLQLRANATRASACFIGVLSCAR